jgi:hypothetical protein
VSFVCDMGIVCYTWKIRIAHYELAVAVSIVSCCWRMGCWSLTVQYTSSSIAMMSRYESRVLWRSCEWYKGTRAASKSTFA